jgi:dTMP kinase
MESETYAFHERVREGFLKIAKSEPRRVKVMNGALTEQEIWVEVRRIAENLIRRRRIGSK